MRKLLVLGFVGAGLLAGCGSTPSAGLKIEPPKGSNAEEVILLGTLELPLSGFGEWGGNLIASDGEIECIGIEESKKFDSGWNIIRFQPNLKLTCNDGRTGNLTVNLSGRSREGMSGVGVGKLSDGSKIRMVVGDTVGSLSW